MIRHKVCIRMRVCWTRTLLPFLTDACKVNHIDHLGLSPPTSSIYVPFTGSVDSIWQERQRVPSKQDNSFSRNAFHEKLKQFKKVNVEETTQPGSWMKPLQPNLNKNKAPFVRGIQLIPTTRLPDRQRSIFNFPIFNVVQSRCFPTAYESSDNLVVSAPTGSGKTVVMELGILRLVDFLRDGQAKVVYQGPTKALCSERYQDWQSKFGTFDICCAELTGDTEMMSPRNIANAGIIITTPEKWDSITRKWQDHAKLMSMIKLFLVDEVHILKDTRGATLEATVSRMKAVGNNIRFIALSATIPNSEDVAAWLTRNEQARHLPAIREVFDDTFRPAQLRKYVLGHEGPYNPWAFDATLTDKVPDVILRYGKRKPVIVFCPTKESAQRTADRLAQSWRDSTTGRRAWNGPQVVGEVENENLQKVLPAAVAFHHASLTLKDRKTVEHGFLKGNVNVICSTSTLAVGVNLPCYLVILKGTQSYVDTGLQEYSSLEVMQMIGRAGRPQFETEACAVILCLNDRVSKYEKMITGEEVLESSLHTNLTEHLNAEIGLRTIDSMLAARKWLSSTFLSIRLQRNPRYYNLSSEAVFLTPEEALVQWCERDLNLLREANMIENDVTLRCTEFGYAMARYCIKFETMKTFMALPAKAKVSEILNALCQAVEFREFRLRQGDKGFYKELNRANEIRYPIKVDIALSQHKVSLMIQARLGCMALAKDTKLKFSSGHLRQLMLDAGSVINHAKRLIRCIVNIFVQRNDSCAVKHALGLARSLAAGAWDDTVMQLKQIPGVGDVFTRKLAAAGIKTVDTLFHTEPHRIEVILSKNPPFGLDLIKKVSEFPMLRISVRESGQKHPSPKGVEVKLCCEVGFLNEKIPIKFNRRSYNILFLCESSVGRLIDFRRFIPSRFENTEILLTAVIDQPGTKICCHVMCDDLAGTHRLAELDINCPDSWFFDAAPTSQASFPRRKVSHQTRVTLVGDEFGDEDVDDSDLLAAARNHQETDGIEDIDDITPEIDGGTSTGKTRKRGRPGSANGPIEQSREPVKLANGRWTCQHTCKEEGKKCKHKCCVEGAKKRPTNKRQRKDQTGDVSGATKRSKKESTNAVDVSANDGPLENPRRSGTTQNIESSSLASGIRAEDQPFSRAIGMGMQTNDSISSRTGIQDSANPHDSRDPQQVLSDAFDFGDYDWQAIDQIAASFESLPDATASVQRETGGCGEWRRDRLTESGLAENVMREQVLDLDSALFNHDDSLAKEMAPHTSPVDTSALENIKHGIFLQDSDPILEVRRGSMKSPETHPQTGDKFTFDVPTVALLDSNLSHIPTIAEADHERQRLEEEDQKRRWAELGSDLLTYETFGKYIRIVDDPK